jgi:hypothetical protein
MRLCPIFLLVTDILSKSDSESGLGKTLSDPHLSRAERVTALLPAGRFKTYDSIENILLGQRLAYLALTKVFIHLYLMPMPKTSFFDPHGSGCCKKTRVLAPDRLFRVAAGE